MMAFSHLAGRSQQTWSERKIKCRPGFLWNQYNLTLSSVLGHTEGAASVAEITGEVPDHESDSWGAGAKDPHCITDPRGWRPSDTHSFMINSDLQNSNASMCLIWQYLEFAGNGQIWEWMRQEKRKFTSLLRLFCNKAVGQSNVQWPAHHTISGMAQPVPDGEWCGPPSRSWPRKAWEGGSAHSQGEAMLFFQMTHCKVERLWHELEPTPGFKSTSFYLHDFKQVTQLLWVYFLIWKMG